jgi:hypothetical protein
MTDPIPLEEAERRWQGDPGPSAGGRQRPTVEGCRKASRMGVVNAGSLLVKPPPARRWLIQDLIPMKATTLFSAHGGDGKSLLALQLAVATATGGRWLGHEIQERGRVGIISCEDDTDEVRHRLWDIMGAEGLCHEDLADIDIWDRVGADSFLTRTSRYEAAPEVTDFAGNVTNWVIDGEIKLLILDSLYNFMSGNQNDWSVAQFFMNTLNGLARDADCSIFVLWHPSQFGRSSGEGSSGANAFHNACRGRLFMEREFEGEGDAKKDTGIRVIRTKKMNRGPDDQEIRCRWEDGRFVPVIPEGGKSFVDRLDIRRRLLECLTSALEAGEAPSPVVEARGNYLPKLLQGRPQVRGLSIRDLERAMQDLRADGELVPGVTPDRPSRQRRILVPKGHPWAVAKQEATA